MIDKKERLEKTRNDTPASCASLQASTYFKSNKHVSFEKYGSPVTLNSKNLIHHAHPLTMHTLVYLKK